MDLQLGVTVTAGRLYNGRRSFYASVTLGRRHYFISRWDTVRVDHSRPAVTGSRRRSFDIRRGPIMTWYAGAF